VSRFAKSEYSWHLLRVVSAASALLALPLAANELKLNESGDPVLQITQALRTCAVATLPQKKLSEGEARSIAHQRAERGTTCYNTGRCRLQNSHLYDREIIPRVKKALTYDDTFANTTIVAEGSRRWVWLRGCVTTQKQKKRADEIVRNIDDVEHVINELVVRHANAANSRARTLIEK
jgi:osmotically-inducible protein OsmY